MHIFIKCQTATLFINSKSIVTYIKVLLAPTFRETNTMKTNMGLVILIILIVVSLIVIVFLCMNLQKGKHNNNNKVNSYIRTNLTSNISSIPAKFQDSSLVNAWSLVRTSSGSWLVTSNDAGLVNQYDNNGQPIPVGSPLSIPIPPSIGGDANPTGIVFNNTNIPTYTYFVANEGGSILGIDSNNNVDTLVDNSGSGAVYKGIAVANNQIYVTNFNSGFVEVYDSNFNFVSQFTDANLPTGYAPFGIYLYNGLLYVSFALQDADKHDDVKGAGNGFVSVFNSNTSSAKRLISNGPLNSPWGMAFSNCNFGKFSNVLLVGNFGDGTINAFDINNGNYVGTISDSQYNPIVIDGLWGISFGNQNSLYFAAGPNGESNGVFGVIGTYAKVY